MEKTVEKIKSRLKDVDELKIEILVQKCLNYMNRKDFPEELILVLVEKLLNDSKNTNNGIKSITEGDTKVEYVTTSETDNLIDSLRPQLNRFRKVGVLNG